MAANLLSRLYHEVIQADQMQKGFKSLLVSVEDLKLDVPAAEDDLALFLARAVVDDILPPAFLKKVACGKASQTKSTQPLKLLPSPFPLLPSPSSLVTKLALVGSITANKAAR